MANALDKYIAPPSLLDQVTKQLRPLPFSVRMVDKASDIMKALGLNQPYKRALFGGILSTTFLWAIQPSFCFNRDGTPKEWKVMSGYLFSASPQEFDPFANNSDYMAAVGMGEEADEDHDTWIPWWMISGVFAAVPALFF
jgi:hypothetical protein